MHVFEAVRGCNTVRSIGHCNVRDGTLRCNALVADLVIQETMQLALALALLLVTVHVRYDLRGCLKVETIACCVDLIGQVTPPAARLLQVVAA